MSVHTENINHQSPCHHLPVLQIYYLKPVQLDLICVAAAVAVDVAAVADVLLTVSVCWQTPLVLLHAHTPHAEYGAL